jgi:hypothetical protein
MESQSGFLPGGPGWPAEMTPNSIGTSTVRIATSRAAIGGNPAVSMNGAITTNTTVMIAPGTKKRARSVGIPSCSVADACFEVTIGGLFNVLLSGVRKIPGPYKPPPSSRSRYTVKSARK